MKENKNPNKAVAPIIILSLFLMTTVFSIFANAGWGTGIDAEPELMTFEYTQLPVDVSGNHVSGNDALQAASATVSGGNAGNPVHTYPVPGYDFTTDEITVRIAGLERDYTIAFVNDLHLIMDHESGDVTEDNLPLVENRYQTLAMTEEGVPAEELWPEVINYLNYNDFDAVIFGGDLLDYCSNSNIMALNAELKRLKYPADRVMYLRSDHDYGGWYGGGGFTDSDGMRLQTLVLDGDEPNKCIEFDDLMIVGINKSYRNISAEAHQFIREKLNQDKPVILATHVPFYSKVDDSLKQESMQVRNRIYYWSHDNGVYLPNKETTELIDEMYAEDSKVVQIVAGHLHAKWDGNVTATIREHIFAPTFEGKIGIIHVVGESVEEGTEMQTEDAD